MYKYWVLFSRDFITRCFSFGSGSSSQPIWLDSVDCNILDTRIIDCYYEAISVQYCGHREDIMINCGTSFVPTIDPAIANTDDGLFVY